MMSFCVVIEYKRCLRFVDILYGIWEMKIEFLILLVFGFFDW